MKAIKISKAKIECIIEDAIFYDNDSFVPVSGDSSNGFVVGARESIEKIFKNGWRELTPLLEDNSEELCVWAGETSWGGIGFVALKIKRTNSFKWLIHLSTMNNPTNIRLEKENVRLSTDLNYPHGIDFIIPIDRPENFKIENAAADKN